MTIKPISRNDTLLFKAFAILGIALHNFFHFIKPLPACENEFAFAENRVGLFLNAFSSSPGDWLNIILSYLGHYGVQVFILISGYGLAVSMIRQRQSWLPFAVRRVSKLLPLLLVGIFLLYLSEILINSRILGDNEWREMKYKVLMLHTLIPNAGMSVVGPWWFFGLIFQLYLLFPPLFQALQKYGWKAFAVIAAICYICIYVDVFNPNDYNHLINVLQNAPGHLPEFMLGIMIALNKDKKVSPVVFIFLIVSALSLFALGNFYKAFFPLTFISASFLLYCLGMCINPLINKVKWLNNIVAYIGGVSMVIFVINGFLRAPFVSLSCSLDTPSNRYYAALLFILTVIGLASVGKPVYQWLVDILSMVINKVSKVKFVLRWKRCLTIVTASLFSLIGLYFIIRYATAGCTDYLDFENASYSIAKDDMYEQICDNTVMDKNYQGMRMSIELDGVNASEPMPMVVYQVDDLVWVGKPITLDNDNHFSYYTIVPFNGNVRGKIFHVYFYNKGGSLDVTNLKLKAEGISSPIVD
ncbi:MAG: acyltransferase [Candidatus Limimorpha sp.]